MVGFDFIADDKLRQTLENSIEFIFALHEKSKGSEENLLYKEETHRIIILYVISAIEAILLYFYKQRGEKMESLEYKFPNTLPFEYSHLKKQGCSVVVAVQEKIEKKDYQIGLHDLVMFFKEKKLIVEKTSNDILKLNDVRNTFHFSKPRVEPCNVSKVEEALKLLVYVIERAPKGLKSS